MTELGTKNKITQIKNLNIHLLLGILLLAAFLRFFSIGYESLWYDEGSSFYGISKGYAYTIEHSARNNQPPLYLLLLKTWSLVFGTSEAALRGMSAVFSIVAVWLAFLIGRSLRNAEAGLILAFLFSVSRFMIEFSQETRNYSLLVMNAMAAALFMLQWMEAKSKSSLFLFLLFSIFTVYSHIYGWFFFLAADIFLVYRLIRKEESFRTIIVLNGLIFIAFLPWLFVMVSQVSHYVNIPWIPKGGSINADIPHWLIPPDASVVRSVLSYFGGTFLVFQFFSILILIHILVNFKKREGIEERLFFLFIWIFCALVIPLIISRLLTPMFQLRYAILACAGFLLFTGIALYDLLERIPMIAVRKGLYGLVILFVLVNLWPAYDDYYKIFRDQHRKEQWREAAGYVRAHLDSDTSDTSDTAVLLNIKKLIYPFGYYFREKNTPLYGVDTAAEFERLPQVRQYQKLLVVFSHNEHYDKNRSVAAWLEEYGHKVASTNLNGICLAIYKKGLK